MPLYEKFYCRKPNGKGNYKYIVKSIDIESVESWELFDSEHTTVFMNSSNSFVLSIEIEDFEDIIMSSVDGLGRLFTFNPN